MQQTLFDRVNFELEPEAERRRQAGMARATAHADTDHDGWSDQAFAFLTRYAAAHDTFMGWQVVQAALDSGAVPEANRKAWGAIFVRAAVAGVISKAGYAPDPNRNQNPAPVWQSCLRRKES